MEMCNNETIHLFFVSFFLLRICSHLLFETYRINFTFLSYWNTLLTVLIHQRSVSLEENVALGFFLLKSLVL